MGGWPTCNKSYSCFYAFADHQGGGIDRIGTFVSSTPDTAFGNNDWSQVFNGSANNVGIAWDTRVSPSMEITFTVPLNSGDLLDGFLLRGMAGGSPAEAFDRVNSVTITGLQGVVSGGLQNEIGPNGATAWEYAQAGYLAQTAETVTVVMEIERSSSDEGNPNGAEIDSIIPLVVEQFSGFECALVLSLIHI